MPHTISRDQRVHTRFTAKHGAMALSSNFCGQITDISPEGIGIEGVWEHNLPAEFLMTILTEDREFYVTEIPVKRSWSTAMPPTEYSNIITRKAGLQFQEIDKNQELRQELERFINKFKKPNA